MRKTENTVAKNIRALGRGSFSNAVSRFEPYTRETFEDGWEIPEESVVLRTEVSIEKPRSLITKNTSPDISFDRSINPYRGCEHGCVYCFARPTHAYLGYSPGLDFETRLIARTGADEVLRRELSKPSYKVAPIAMGTNTDPYQPVEARYQIMRSILKVLAEFQHPVTIVTRGTLIERDLDILAPMARAGLVKVGVSVTTLDAKLARAMEPRAPAPKRRLQMISRLSEAGVPVRAMAAPVIPGLTDNELEKILEACATNGATSASWIMLRLPIEVSDLFQEWLQHHAPNKVSRVMTKVREMHDGQTYSAQWGRRMRGQGTYAELIRHRFALACRNYSLATKVDQLRCDLFKVPGQAEQLSLF